ncbi:ATP-binding protein [[Eubacterium] rectale]|uniref:ATP-binding protein n=1 Tax=Agathobacter rectalis TaxID=39491 RepID=A0AAW4U4V6_9FIRM|nr:AAA family ATPase [Agathobacter rectalis]MCB5929955.1 ATP-binding protein [Agathobacter rectalis]MCB6936805.1 ATP-binding protein [Agathobacter rectalis]MCB6969413.1 ATP-binding protein [Agathobacter rectalis]MCQ4888555.1 ATP-binding protein [Agathobacter rectalis]MCQ4929043.1 ATP-binding protein [Agathobacter rectalis]
MANTLKLPVGIDDFRKLRESHFYYVDKTRLIEQLLLNWSEVTLFTRPRRFGKTLNMSMLKSFFDIGTDKALFDGLYISGNKELCDEYMGKYPVIFLSLKGVEGLTYEEAFEAFVRIMGKEVNRVSFLADSDKLTQIEREQYNGLTIMKNGRLAFDKEKLISSLQLLSQLLYKHYGKKVVILIDEYDVPLDKAFQNGYYKEMVSLIRGLFGQALKTNEFLQFAVLTGCLRISKESIFTGLNNFKVMSITDSRFDEQFGFTDIEVKKLLSDYGMDSHFDEVKEWYDGYHFGRADVYCPWDVINHADHLRDDSDAKPQTYWINSSGNSLVRRLINRADSSTKDEIERLIAGEAIEKVIRLDLTYDEIENSIDNIWSVLFTTGYLTKIGEVKLPDSESYAYRLVIPNKEVREVFVLQIQEWFKAVVANDNDTMKLLSKAILDKDEAILARQLNIVMGRMISILDTKASDDMKENFYHGLLLGLLRGSNPDWLIKSNRESGDGFSDILIKPENPDLGIVIEVKYAKEFKGLDAACDVAMAQIKQKRYDETLRDEGRCDILAYGIAFCRKRCKVAGEKL